MKYVMFLLLIASSSCWAQTSPAVRRNHIEGEVSINTHTNQYSVNLDWIYVPLDSAARSVVFYLDKKVAIRRITSEVINRYQVDTTAKDFQAITITFQKIIAPNQAAKIHFNYAGLLDSLLYKRYGIIELGLDWFWYPVHASFTGITFDYKLRVTVDNPTLKLFSNGKISPNKNQFVVQSMQPDYDINLFLSKEAQVSQLNQEGYSIDVVVKPQKLKLADSLAYSIRSILQFYNSTFGYNHPQNHVQAIIRPVPDSVRDLGYFRKGYFVIVEPDKMSSILPLVAHELSHYWWSTARPDEEEWLNESFAEYSALMAIRKLQGTARFLQLMEEKKKRVERANEKVKQSGGKVPAVYRAGKKRPNQFNFIATYFKGPILLEELEASLGEEHFARLLRAVANTRVSSTQDFLTVLTELEGQMISNKFYHRLKEY